MNFSQPATSNIEKDSAKVRAQENFGPSPFLTGDAQLGFGAWAVGGQGWGPAPSESDRISAIRRAFDQGVRFFDSAPTYGDSERLLGAALGSYKNEITIATKVGPLDNVRESLEESLRRLKTDHIDLLQLHEALHGYERQIDALYALQQQGKIGHIGLCNATPQQIETAHEIAPIHTYQSAYNLIDREAENIEIPACREHKIAFIAYRPLASGMLAGIEKAEFSEEDHRRGIYWFKDHEFDRRKQVISQLRGVAQKKGTSLAALALAWVLSRPDVSVVLAGARTAEQVDQNIEATRRHLDPGEIEAIDEVVDRIFRPARATEKAASTAASWGKRERFIVERLDGLTRYETIATEWSKHQRDPDDRPLIAAQVKVFVDRLADEGLVVFDA